MEKLIQKAHDMRHFSHAPHSNFKVGAGLLTVDGIIIGGCNIESDSYGLTMCAERNAIFTAFAQGHREFKAMAIALSNHGTPCGACRQIIAELCGDITIYITDLKGNIANFTAFELLPHHFTLNPPLNLATKIHEASCL